MKRIKGKKSLTLTTNATLFLRTRNGVFKIEDIRDTKSVKTTKITKEQYLKEKKEVREQ